MRADSDSNAFRIVLDSLWGKLTGSPQSSDICLSYITLAILLWELTEISQLGSVSNQVSVCYIDVGDEI